MRGPRVITVTFPALPSSECHITGNTRDGWQLLVNNVTTPTLRLAINTWLDRFTLAERMRAIAGGITIQQWGGRAWHMPFPYPKGGLQ